MVNPPVRQLADDIPVTLPREYIDFCVVRKMGWDWWTYQNQPSFFIKQITAFLDAEAKADRVRSKLQAWHKKT